MSKAVVVRVSEQVAKGLQLRVAQGEDIDRLADRAFRIFFLLEKARKENTVLPKDIV